MKRGIILLLVSIGGYQSVLVPPLLAQSSCPACNNPNQYVPLAGQPPLAPDSSGRYIINICFDSSAEVKNDGTPNPGVLNASYVAGLTASGTGAIDMWNSAGYSHPELPFYKYTTDCSQAQITIGYQSHSTIGGPGCAIVQQSIGDDGKTVVGAQMYLSEWLAQARAIDINAAIAHELGHTMGLVEVYAGLCSSIMLGAKNPPAANCTLYQAGVGVASNDVSSAVSEAQGSATACKHEVKVVHKIEFDKPCGSSLNTASGLYSSITEAFLFCEGSGTTLGEGVSGQNGTINPSVVSWGTGPNQGPDIQTTGGGASGTTASIAPSSAPLSVVALVKVEDTSSTGQLLIVDKYQDPEYFHEGVQVGENSGGGLFVKIGTSGDSDGIGQDLVANFSGSLRDGNWHVLIVTTDGTNSTAGTNMYLDGAALTNSGGNPGSDDFGPQSDAGVAFNMMDFVGSAVAADLDTLQIYHCVLTATQIASIMEDPYSIWR